MLSFVIPCYRSENTVEKVINEIIEIVSQRKAYDYEIIAVNDRSPDNVLQVLERLAAQNPKIKVVDLVKNMGKHAAVLAGYSFVRGDYVIDLDDDCHSPTYELWKLLEPVEHDECDYATAKYSVKREKFYKRIGSDLNVLMGHIMLEKPISLRFENFNAMKAFVAKKATEYKNPYPYLEGLVLRITNRIMCVPMEQRERGDDNPTGFTLKKSLHLFTNGLTAFSVKPLRVASVSGVVFAVLGIIFTIVTVVRKILNPDILVGYSSLMAVLLVSSGMIMVMLGIIGEYIGRIYICINDSPQYVIRKTINLDGEQSASVQELQTPEGEELRHEDD